MADFADRNIEPTARRRLEARRDGRVPRSPALASAIVIVGGLAVLMTFGHSAAEMTGRLLKQHLGGKAALSISQDKAAAGWQEVTIEFLLALAPILAGFFLVAIVANFAQTGFLFLPKNVAPQVDRLSPLHGVRRMFSSTNFVSVVIGLIQVALAVTFAWWCLKTELPRVVQLAELRAGEMVRSAGSILFSAAMKVGLGLFALALLDYAYRRWNHERELRMTPEQLRDELRMIEGDPQVESRRRQLRR